MNKNEEYKPVFYENFQTAALNITRREWFAGMALQGYRSSPEWGCATSKSTAEAAVIDSDAMILALDSAK